LGAIDTSLILNDIFSTSVPVYQLPYNRGNVDPVYTVEYENGVEHRRSVRSKGKRVFSLRFDYLDSTDQNTLWDFYVARRGSKSAFYWKDERNYQITTEAVGTGDGSRTLWLLANNSIKAASETIYVDSVAKTDPTDYSLDDDTGLITFVSAVTSSLAITADYQYYVKVHFAMDSLAEEEFTYNLFRNGIELVEDL